MSSGPSGPVRPRTRRAGALAVAVALLLVGCTYTTNEPGLFEPTRPARVEPQPRPERHRPVPATNPALPVFSDQTWTSADGLGVEVRIAVHGVRRISGATVLDWSVTPVRVPNLFSGDLVQPTVDLGLSPPGDDRPRITLIDSARGLVYRPLAKTADPSACLCTPLSAAEDRLRVGLTTLLQVAFPQLPASTAGIDVAIATVLPAWRVPVTPIGEVPVAESPTDLGRAADDRVRGQLLEMFRYGPGEQVFRFELNGVAASPTFTALAWTIWSVTGGDGLEATPPPGGTDDGPLVGPTVTSGPVLVVRTDEGARTLRVRRAGADPRDSRVQECLCTPLHGWTGLLRRPDKPVTVVTTYPPLPVSSEQVEVRFEGLGSTSVAVTPALDAQVRSPGSRPWSPTTWPVAGSRPPSGWDTGQWPTPVPPAELVKNFRGAAYPLTR